MTEPRANFGPRSTGRQTSTTPGAPGYRPARGVPTLRVGDHFVELQRLTITLRETARVVYPDLEPRAGYRRARALVRSGQLVDVAVEGRTIRIDPEQVARLIESKAAVGEVSHRALVDLAALISVPAGPR